MNTYDNERRALTEIINSGMSEREVLEAKHGQVWNTSELQKDFTVESFLAPFVGVTRKADGARGLLTFQHRPRFYWGFTIG